MQETFTLKQIYNMLSTQSFVDWYEEDFRQHIEGQEFSKQTPQILEDLENFLK
jgi:hypothetical protein